VINEIYWDEYSTPWIEIYNPTDKAFSLTSLTYLDIYWDSILPVDVISLAPREYILFCKDMINFTTEWSIPDGTKIFELDYWGHPAFIYITSTDSDGKSFTDSLVANYSYYPLANHSWSRYRYGFDTDNFDEDFYNEPLPTPGYENRREKGVNYKPVIGSYDPLVDPIIKEGENLTFGVTAHDPEGYPLTYQWYIDGHLLASEQGSTYTYHADYNSSGLHNITVIVSDGKLNVSHQWNLTVLNVNLLPTIRIISPTNGTIINGTVTISGTAADIDGIIEFVQIKIGTGSWQNVTGTTAWSYLWDTSQINNGVYTIYARAYDGSDFSELASVTLFVNNPDNDLDSIPDAIDPDDDNDDYPDTIDAFPFDPTEWSDTDNDSIGDNADPDDDNDGYNDTIELLEGSDPLDNKSTPPDFDNDYIPDSMDDDIDDDGVLNEEDDYPYDPTRWEKEEVKKKLPMVSYALIIGAGCVIIVVVIVGVALYKLKKRKGK
jgi:hypothetical protein